MNDHQLERIAHSDAERQQRDAELAALRAEITGTTEHEAPGTGLIAIGIVLATVGVLAGLLIGAAVGATRVSDGWGDGIASMTDTPLGDTRKTFNWLLFLLTAGPTLIAGSVITAGGAVVNALDRR